MLQCMGWQRVRCGLATKQLLQKQLMLRDIKYLAQGHIAHNGTETKETRMETLNFCFSYIAKSYMQTYNKNIFKYLYASLFSPIQQYSTDRLSIQNLKVVMFGWCPNKSCFFLYTAGTTFSEHLIILLCLPLYHTDFCVILLHKHNQYLEIKCFSSQIFFLQYLHCKAIIANRIWYTA